MKRMILLLALCVLSACTTPRQSCLIAATRDLAIVDELILETRANLQRGYALAPEYYTGTQFGLCLGGWQSNLGWSYCAAPEVRTRLEPVAIDRAAEERKLRELQQTRARLEREARAKLDACNAQYPAASVPAQ